MNPCPAHDEFHPRFAKSRNLKEERLIGLQYRRLATSGFNAAETSQVSRWRHVYVAAKAGRTRLCPAISSAGVADSPWLRYRHGVTAGVASHHSCSTPCGSPKLMIDTVVAARCGPDTVPAVASGRGGTGYCSWGGSMERASTAIEALFGDLCSNRINEKLIAHAATLDLRHFEDPAFYDRLERAQRQTTGRIGLLTQVLSVGQDSVTLVSLASAVLFYSPWLVVLLVLAILPSFLGEAHFQFTGVLAALPLDAGTSATGLPALLKCGGRDCERSTDLRIVPMAARNRYRTLARTLHEANRSLALRKGVVATALAWLASPAIMPVT